jgi:hypothetical protein
MPDHNHPARHGTPPRVTVFVPASRQRVQWQESFTRVSSPNHQIQGQRWCFSRLDSLGRHASRISCPAQFLTGWSLDRLDSRRVPTGARLGCFPTNRMSRKTRNSLCSFLFLGGPFASPSFLVSCQLLCTTTSLRSTFPPPSLSSLTSLPPLLD